MSRLVLRDFNLALWLLVGLTVVGATGGFIWAGNAGPVRHAVSALSLQSRDQDGTLDPEVLAAAERLNDARAWHLLARLAADPNWPELDEAAAAKYAHEWRQRADQLAPRDPVIALDRALVAADDASSDEALAAAKRATQLDADNAAAWYTLAATRGAQNDAAGALAAIVRGNRAPRCDLGRLPLFEARRRFAQEARWPLALVDLTEEATDPSTNPEDGLRAAFDLQRPASPDVQVELIAAAARLQEVATTASAASSATQLYRRALLAHSSQPNDRPPEEKRDLATELSDAGKTKQAQFTQIAARRASVYASYVPEYVVDDAKPVSAPRLPLVDLGAALISWLSLAALAWVAAGWLLLAAGSHAIATAKRPRPDGWAAENLLLVWLFSVFPAAIGAVWLVAQPLHRQIVLGAPDASVVIAMLTLPLWPLLGSVIAIAVTRRAAAADSPGARGLLMPTAALLLLLAAAALGGSIVAYRTESATLATFNGDQMVQRRADLDAAGRLPKVSWPAPH
ncbi:MAG TPA: hypothetical protein DCZ72_01550 [Armatimonadetes bacterium]|nr:hypothetical protein [Armatimonadota bacterium]